MFSESDGSNLSKFLEETFAEYCVRNEHDIHERIDELIAVKKQGNGKGGRKSSRKSTAPQGAGGGGVKPSNVDWKHASCTVNFACRSVIEPISQRQDSATTLETLFRDAADECKTAVRTIVKQCKASRKRFFDSSFYFDPNNVIPPNSPSDCTVTPPVDTARLSELFPSAPLFAQDVSCDDVVQGQVGDCFLIGAVSALAAANPAAVKTLFVAFDAECGVYGFVFFKDGGWEWVIIDDIIAVQKFRDTANPLYAACVAQVELWPMLLEKAYAKVHYNWDTIDGGWAKEALVDMTGGIPYSIDLHGDQKSTSFKTFKGHVDNPLTILGCAVGEHVESSEASGNAGEEGATFGLFHGHQYSVIRAAETSDGCGFVQVRNPWGNDAEWTGPYGDRDVAWTQNPLHKKEINPSFENDGTFWMKWEDFKQYMSAIDIVRLFPSDFKCLSLFGKGQSEVTPTTTFVLQICDAPTEITIALGQDDPKVKYSSAEHKSQRKAYRAMKLAIFRLRQLPKSHDEFDHYFDYRVSAAKTRERSTFHSQVLEPGLYCITAQLIKPDSTTGFYLRVIGPPDADYALWRFSEEEGSKLSVGICPPVNSSEPVQSVQAVPKGGPAAKDDEELRESQEYIDQLEKLLRKKQDEIDQLRRQSQTAPASPPRKKTALERLGMSTERWNGAIDQVFNEVAAGAQEIDTETAVNAFRLIVTLGAEMDECFLAECKLRGEGPIDIQSFYSLCNTVAKQWKPLVD